MTSADERILDLALEEVIGDATPPDLSEPILRATNRPRVLSAMSRRPRRATLAASILVAAAALGAVLVWSRPKPATPVAEPWARDGVSGEAVAVGERLEGPRRVVFRTGAEIDAAAAALFTVRDDGAFVTSGRVTVRGALRVTTIRGLIEFDATAFGSVEVTPDALNVALRRGHARVGDKPLQEGESIRIPPRPEKKQEKKPDPPPVKEPEKKPEPPKVPTLAAKEKEQLDSLAALIRVSRADLDKRKPETFDPHKAALDAHYKLSFMLWNSAAARAYLRPELSKLPGDAKRADVKTRLLELLAYDDGSRTLILAELRKDATLFLTNTLLLLAERGESATHEELARRAAGPTDINAVTAAVFFGLRGDPRAKTTLHRFRASGMVGKYPDHYLASAAAREILGEQTWDAAVGFTRRRMNALLAKKQLFEAAQRVLHLEYFAAAVKTRKPVDLSYLSLRLGAHVAKHMKQLTTEKQIRELFQRIEKR